MQETCNRVAYRENISEIVLEEILEADGPNVVSRVRMKEPTLRRLNKDSSEMAPHTGRSSQLPRGANNRNGQRRLPIGRERIFKN